MSHSPARPARTPSVELLIVLALLAAAAIVAGYLVALLNPDPVYSLSYRGVAYEETGQDAPARADYERVVEFDMLEELTIKARGRLATRPQ